MAQALHRRPAVAGQFYPEEPGELRRMVNAYLDRAGIEPAPARVAAIVSPHAGYVYSGATAGFAYARVRGKHPTRVVLVGTSHRYRMESGAVFSSGAFDTPLGEFTIDETFSQLLAAQIGSESREPHMQEHALEVQLPFLAQTVGLVPIVPVLFGSHASEWHAQLGVALARLMDPTDLLIASTDLSHYLDERNANAIDRHSIEVVLSKDWKAFAQGVRDKSCAMCGSAAVVTAMAFSAARHADEWKLLDYRTSAVASGDFKRVVGYAAMSMEYAA